MRELTTPILRPGGFRLNCHISLGIRLIGPCDLHSKGIHFRHEPLSDVERLGEDMASPRHRSDRRGAAVRSFSRQILLPKILIGRPRPFVGGTEPRGSGLVIPVAACTCGLPLDDCGGWPTLRGTPQYIALAEHFSPLCPRGSAWIGRSECHLMRWFARWNFDPRPRRRHRWDPRGSIVHHGSPRQVLR